MELKSFSVESYSRLTDKDLIGSVWESFNEYTRHVGVLVFYCRIVLIVIIARRFHVVFLQPVQPRCPVTLQCVVTYLVYCCRCAACVSNYEQSAFYLRNQGTFVNTIANRRKSVAFHPMSPIDVKSHFGKSLHCMT